jgi:hypothetical protein
MHLDFSALSTYPITEAVLIECFQEALQHNLLCTAVEATYVERQRKPDVSSDKRARTGHSGGPIQDTYSSCSA